MNKEQNFLNGSFFKESKYGFQIDIDPEDIKRLKLRNGKYRIEAKRPRNNPEKWYLAENTWEPQGGFKATSSGTPYQEKFKSDFQIKPLNNGDFQVDDIPDFLK